MWMLSPILQHTKKFWYEENLWYEIYTLKRYEPKAKSVQILEYFLDLFLGMIRLVGIMLGLAFNSYDYGQKSLIPP